MTALFVRHWAATCLMLSAATGSVCAEGVPKFAPKPGQLLTYEQSQTFTSRGEDSRYKTTWRLWVTGQNADGSWRIVAREGMKTLGPQGSSHNEQEMVTFARFDLYADGKVPSCSTLGTRFDPSQMFPPLPADLKAATAGWQTRDDRDDITIRCEPLPQKDKNHSDTFDFAVDQSTFMEKIYEGSDRRIFHFDRKKGLVSRAELARAFGAHIQGKGTGTLELTSIEQIEPVKMVAFREQMDRYFDAHEAYLVLYRKARTSGNEAEALLKKASSILADGRAAVTIPEAVAAFDDQLKNDKMFGKQQVDEAKRFAKLIGQPAPSWEIKDLEGRTHTLDQYRGKVLVLDFWYRGCGWCMRAMPQVRHLASHYRDRPVAVFGMNNDRKEDDAKFVVQKMQLEYPVLRSDGTPGKYGVTGFPTLVLIDQQGKVADVHVGYSPHLFEEVSAAVDRLLGAR
jgi:peroxiredoxin